MQGLLIWNWVQGVIVIFLYSGIVVALLVALLVGIIYLSVHGKNALSILRRFTGAVPPLLVLFFLVVQQGNRPGGLPVTLAGLDPWIQTFFGVILGALAINWGLLAANERTESDDRVGLVIIYLSSIGSLITYCLIYQIMMSMTWLVCGLVVGLLIYFVVWGLSSSAQRKLHTA